MKQIFMLPVLLSCMCTPLFAGEESPTLERGDLIGKHMSALRRHYGDAKPLLKTASRVTGITEAGTQVGMWQVGDGVLVIEMSLGAGFVMDISYVIMTGTEQKRTTLKVKEFNLTKGEMVITVPGRATSKDSPASFRDKATPATARQGEPATVVLSGEQELDVELVSFRSTNNRRQSWVFGFHTLTDPKAFTLELMDDDSFATSFIKENPGFMKEYWEERQAIGKKEKTWDYTKPVSPYQRFHIKVNARPSGTRILEWKPMDGQTPEDLANAVLQDRVALCRRVGLARPGDDVFLMELDVNLYQAALDSKDKKLKALAAVTALRSMPHPLKDGEKRLSEEEQKERLGKNPTYKKLKAWYLELIHKPN